MASAVSELMVAVIKLTALQSRFGLVAAEVAALSAGQMYKPAVTDPLEQSPRRSFDVELYAATQAIKAKLLGGRECGFRNVLQVNFPDDEIRAMAEAALLAARRAE
jgi:hypothetical protein